MEYEIQIYETTDGKRPFSEWLENLKDIQAKAKIRVRLAMGNFGKCEPVGGSVSELKMDFGPGYRVYFGKIGNTCVLLLSGGIKRKQVSDIEKAKAFFSDYKARKD